MNDINWFGFYLMNNGELVLGPFQGKPACIRIALGRGVCGTAAATGEVQTVEDVHQYAGHIACDSASASELVIPMFWKREIFAVMDIDSPRKNRFTEQDAEFFKKVAEDLTEKSDIDAVEAYYKF